MPSFTVYKGSKEGKIIESTTTREVDADEVLVRVTHSGLCGTDEHYKQSDMVLGHEGIGIVEEIGDAVKTLKKGDSVGWGYMHDSCGHCKQCFTGFDTLCPERKMYGFSNLDQGSFGHAAVWKEDFLFKIPGSIPIASAAPLMCGGATVFNALSQFTKPTDRVGIIGIGGLGHLAIQFAAHFGCEVVVFFSSTEAKKAEAMLLGAREFVATKGIKDLKLGKLLDHLLVTTSQQPDWRQYLPLMAPRGVIYPLTISASDMRMPYTPIIIAELRIQGSMVAAKQVQRDMLEFAATHNIKPIVELFPMSISGVMEAMEKLREGRMRYRGVLVV